MKKLFLFLVVSYSFNLCAQTNNLDGMCFKVLKKDTYNHCLQSGSDAAIHLFDVLPKIRDYKYTGDANYNNPNNSNTIFYPSYQNTAQKYELKQYIKVDQGNSEMIVTITDLDLADIKGKQEFTESIEGMKKRFKERGIEIPAEMENVSYTANRLQLINSFKTMFNVAKQLNTDYLPAEGVGMMTVNLDNFENAYVVYKDLEKEANFSASYADRYLFTIQIKNVNKYNSCNTLMAYLSPYLAEVALGSLDRNIYFK
ncbi:hypothetical protein [Leeuwenhoekiella sp. NPDC079379]|uniref:hypothetical protein n=1 Tax=Leeuwenhoekiella sp. NPDC079379 TaxID=3364122 RepID=UPI0037CB0621